MASYQLIIRKSIRKDLAKIPSKEAERIWRAIDGLAVDPRPAGAKKMVASAWWRLRIGDYRVVYDIEDRWLTIEVVRVAHRREAYR